MANKIVYGDEQTLDSFTVEIPAGESASFQINTIVPMAAQMGDSNTITIRTTHSNGEVISNRTKLVVMELAELDITGDQSISAAPGLTGVANIMIKNTGNVDLIVSLTLGTIPSTVWWLHDCWELYGMNQQAVILLWSSLVLYQPDLKKIKYPLSYNISPQPGTIFQERFGWTSWSRNQLG